MPIIDWILLVAVLVLNIVSGQEAGDGRRRSRPDRKSATPIPDEQRLLKKVFNRNYDNSVRPVYNATNNVMVYFGLTLIQIMDMEEKNQVLVINVWLEHEWVDERIKWDPSDYNNLRMIRIPAHKLWLPDIVLYNNADDYTTGYMPSNAMVESDGRIFWSPPARLRAACKVDITYFPFDEQTCKLKFGSWTYDQAQVDISNKSQEIDMSNYITNGEWALINSVIERNEVIYPISPAVYPDVTLFFTIRRRILYYILNIILPCVWLNMLSLLAFCLPPDAGEKITLGITVLLSYSVFMLLIAENMPPTSEFVPLIGIYLTISMALTSISVILTVGVLKLHHCGPHQSEVPKWVRFVVLKCLARLIGCQCFPAPSSKRGRKEKKNNKKLNSRLASENAEVCLRLVNDVNQLNKRSPLGEGGYRGGGGGRAVSGHYGQIGDGSCHEEMGGIAPINMSSISSDFKRLAIMEEILKYLKIMVAKRDEDDNENEVISEWRHVAQVMDRCLFWLFLTTTMSATLVLMVFIPLSNHMS